MVRNELLQSILEIGKQEITDEISKSKCLAVLCDETTDVFDKSQMVGVFRYEKSGEPVERFLGFFKPTRLTAPSLATVSYWKNFRVWLGMIQISLLLRRMMALPH